MNEQPVDEFLDLACLLYGADDPSRQRQALALLKEAPELAQAKIHAAVVCGDLATVTQRLSANPAEAVELGGPRDWPPLLYLCYARLPGDAFTEHSVAIATLLLDAGADPNSFFLWDDTYRFTALTGAIGEGEAGLRCLPPHAHAHALVRLLLARGADPNDGQGLYNSMFTESDEWIEILLDAGLNSEHGINWKTPSERGTLDFLLGVAVTQGYGKRVKLLLDHGARADGVDAYSELPHHVNALQAGEAGIAELLLAHGATTHALTPDQAFRAACFCLEEDEAERLLAQHPDFLEDPSLLRDAAARGKTDVMELLLKLGFPVDGVDDNNCSALHSAAWDGQVAAIELLLAAGADPSRRDSSFNSTPLGHAGHAGRDEAVRVLLKHSRQATELTHHGAAELLANLLADEPELVSKASPSGHPLLHFLPADPVQAEPVLDVLLAEGADLQAKDPEGLVAVEYHERAGHHDTAALLRAAQERLDAT